MQVRMSRIPVKWILLLFSNHLQWYKSTIQSVASKPEGFNETAEEDHSERIIYSYETAFHGFAAKLSEDEAKKLEAEDGIISIYEDTIYQLHTTRSPEFLGLKPGDSAGVWSDTVSDHDVVVEVFDNGIWPESESFSDSGMTPVPAHWKGACETGRGFHKHHCNRKLSVLGSFTKDMKLLLEK